MQSSRRKVCRLRREFCLMTPRKLMVDAVRCRCLDKPKITQRILCFQWRKTGNEVQMLQCVNGLKKKKNM
ncbi:hypothetical protein PR048_009897 [Dryococelus australis]|uniref:Uncharacterized protein n=1 Tax=Dryococelus australis TaxID=614101 RepID=A0ABQ9I187_9NEOP|nr:hypothetical protein PR048_009897 [Dryococelus australis]